MWKTRPTAMESADCRDSVRRDKPARCCSCCTIAQERPTSVLVSIMSYDASFEARNNAAPRFSSCCCGCSRTSQTLSYHSANCRSKRNVTTSAPSHHSANYCSKRNVTTSARCSSAPRQPGPARLLLARAEPLRRLVPGRWWYHCGFPSSFLSWCRCQRIRSPRFRTVSLCQRTMRRF